MRSLTVISALLVTLHAQPASEEPHDLVLAGGRVMDPASGLDAPRHVGISGGRIAAVSTQPLAGRLVVDVSGLVVAPGFIDLHAHGQTPENLAIQSRDGVTTALEMEMGVFPVAAWYEKWSGRMPINFGASVGHLTVRFLAFHPRLEIGHWAVNPGAIAALGAMPAGANRAAGPAEIRAMEASLNHGLDEGALGVGFGVNYTPAATRDELEAMFRVAAARRVPAFIHVRASGYPHVKEAIDLARRTGAALHLQHLGTSALHDMKQVLAEIDRCRAEGMDVTAEVYPYTVASTLLESAFFNEGWRENLGIDYGDVAWAATGERLTKESFDRHRKQGGWALIYLMKDADVDQAITHPGVMIASDGLPFVKGKGHPRGAGTFARVLGHYSRERGLLPLMTALEKMTILPARRLEAHVPAMKAKGRIALGADADLTIFNPVTVLDRATFDQPTQPSAGIAHVMVGGVFVVRDGQPVPSATAGRGVRAHQP